MKLGISLSSQILLSNLDKFLERPEDQFRKKEVKAEESLLKYLTRTSTKTSPFSFFTQLSAGRVQDVFSTKKLDKAISHTTLNNQLLHFFTSVLKHIPAVADQILVRLNPTVTLVDGNYLFLTNNLNVEAFQRIDASPLVEMFVEFFAEQPEGIRLQEAIKTLVEGEYVDASSEELRGFILSLFEYGLLEWDFEVSGIDPFWDKKLIEKIRSWPNPNLRELELTINALQEARKTGENFGDIPAEKRWFELKSSFERFKTQCLELHKIAGLPEDERLSLDELEAKRSQEKKEETPKEEEEESAKEVVFKHQGGTYFHFKPEQFLYEDVHSDIEIELDEKYLDEVLLPLRRAMAAVQDFEGFEAEHERMLAFFNREFPQTESVDLLQFYESLYRNVKVPEHKAMEQWKEDRKKDEKAEMPKPVVEAENTKEKRKRAKDQLGNWIKANTQWNGEKLNLNTSDQEIAFHKKYPVLSFGSFIQPYYNFKSPKAVLNSVFPGFGKMFSRFLHLFPEEISRMQKEYNEKDKGSALFVENTDASYFNANLHPPLTSWEIKAPGSHNTLPAKQQLAVTDIEVVKAKDRLELRKKGSNENIYVFDLGFQGHKGRSELYQLLTKFSVSPMLSIHPILELVDEQFKDQYPKHIKPELWLDEKLLIRRKTWEIPKEDLPEIAQHYSDEELYRVILEWKCGLDLPDKIFLRVVSHMELDQLAPEKRKELGRDAYKPQYVDFANIPLVVNLFKKLISKVPRQLEITEMAPGPENMLALGPDKNFVTELMIQWYE
ncbi:MAG: lantibiotic dehydratase [Luteibaculum sp.]